MPLKLGLIHQGDCLKLLPRIDAESIDLAFADPPFNIGYKYDKYHDRQDDQAYLDWCQAWIGELYRVLKPSGTFWLAIGDEYAAELKWIATRALTNHFIMRSWVVWYYTFGVNCTRKFNRSHAHLFQFIKDEKKFTFNADDKLVRVPSARALVYGDNRANPDGRLPDDTWVLRPQDAPESFQPMDDTWYYSRVAGTFKERQGFHGCQMPEQLLGRIIRVSSNEGDVVFDPFTGSGTTLAVAKKLGRRFLGTELSEDYAKFATERLIAVSVGTKLDGPSDPASSSPNTASGVRLDSTGRRVRSKVSTCDSKHLSSLGSIISSEQQVSSQQQCISEKGILAAVREAFLSTHEGFSIDRLLADPELDKAFVDRCRRLGVPGNAAEVNRTLIRLRKAGKLHTKFTPRSVPLSAADFDRYVFAAEIAWKLVRVEHNDVSLDEILCDPRKTKLFDDIARDFAPGYRVVEYRWAALRLRKRGKDLRKSASSLASSLDAERFRPAWPLEDLDQHALIEEPGLYVVKDLHKRDLYLGDTDNLKFRLELHKLHWKHQQQPAFAAILPRSELLKPSKLCLVARRLPCLNLNLAVVKS